MLIINQLFKRCLPNPLICLYPRQFCSPRGWQASLPSVPHADCRSTTPAWTPASVLRWHEYCRDRADHCPTYCLVLLVWWNAWDLSLFTLWSVIVNYLKNKYELSPVFCWHLELGLENMLKIERIYLKKYLGCIVGWKILMCKSMCDGRAST